MCFIGLYKYSFRAEIGNALDYSPESTVQVKRIYSVTFCHFSVTI